VEIFLLDCYPKYLCDENTRTEDAAREVWKLTKPAHFPILTTEVLRNHCQFSFAVVGGYFVKVSSHIPL